MPGGNIRTAGFMPLDSNGNVPVAIKSGGGTTPSQIYTQKLTIGTTAVTLSSYAAAYVLIYPDPSNTGNVYLGNSTSNGFPIDKGNTLSIEISDSGNVELIADSTGQIVNVLIGGV